MRSMKSTALLAVCSSLVITGCVTDPASQAAPASTATPAAVIAPTPRTQAVAAASAATPTAVHAAAPRVQVLAPPAPTAPRLSVSFKLDPRLAGGTYGGERWVSPPTFMGAAAQDTVQARVDGFGAQGQRLKISPKWTASDLDMIDVTPGDGGVFNIKVKRAGESTLEVAALGVSKVLAIKAEQKNNVMQVQLAQPR